MTMRIVPKPSSVLDKPGTFQLKKRSAVVGVDGSPESEAAAAHLRALLEPLVKFELTADGAGSGVGAVELALDHALAGGPEAYEIEVTPERVRLTAGSKAGLLHAGQTFRQWLPLETVSGVPAPESGWTLPCCLIQDRPKFRWRGLMLDSGKCYIPMSFLKRMIDLMGLLKLNVLHWHLIEDYGWRVEINAYPKLTEVGAYWHPEPHRHGYYTQDEIRELVAYAAEREIMVVPEVELPGHCLSAMLSHPELCCTGKPRENPGHQKDLFCAGKEFTFRFLEAVINEMVELFPAPYAHIGGDEAPKDRWRECPLCQERIRQEGLADENALQGYMFRRMAEMLAVHGKRMIGWEEILDGDESLPQDAMVCWWRNSRRGARHAVEAAAKGHDVVACPNSWNYLTFPVNPPLGKRKMNRTTDLREIYQADYVPEELSESERKRIIGGEVCMWMGQARVPEIERYLFPRSFAVAERLWTDDDKRDANDFFARTFAQYPLLDALGVQYGPAFRRNGEGGKTA